jgi:hypothetical protein
LVRTTLTLDDDVARQLRRRAHGTPGGFKSVVNDTLRRGLTAGVKPAPAAEPFVVEAKSCGFLPGIDHLKLNQLADALEAEEFAERHGRKRRPS